MQAPVSIISVCADKCLAHLKCENMNKLPQAYWLR